MPLVDVDNQLPSPRPYDLEIEGNATFKEVTRATLESGLFGTTASYLASRFGTDFEADENYNVADDLTGYEGYANRFAGVESRLEADTIKRRIDDENQRRSVIASGSTGEMIGAVLATAPFDPVNYVGLGAAKNALRIARTVEGGAKAAGIGAGVTLAEEGAMQQLQETRTTAESVTNIAANTVLFGIMGAAAANLSRPQLDALANNFADAVNTPLPDGSLSAAAAPGRLTLEQETLKSALGLEKALGFQDPVLRTAQSPSIVTRQIAEQIASQSLLRQKAAEGIASPVPVETSVKAYERFKYEAFNAIDEQFMAYRGRANTVRGRVAESLRDLTGRSRSDGMLTRYEFGEAVVKAMRRNDESEIPEVAAAARATREKLISPVYERGVKAGIFSGDEQVKTAPSYVTRLWDKAQITGRRAEFKEINLQWLKMERDTAIKQLKELKAQVKATAKVADDTAAQMAKLEARAKTEDAELSQLADEIVERIVGSPTGRLPYDFKIEEGATRGGSARNSGMRGPARERVYNIPDEMVEGFLINDYDTVMSSYVRSLAPDIELANRGIKPDLTEQLKAIELDYAKLLNRADNKTAARLKKQLDKDRRDIDAMVGRLRGTYGQPDDYASPMAVGERFALQLNYMRLLGGMTISAFTDIARPVMMHGLGRVFGDGLSAMVRDLKTFKAAAAEVKEAGTALDMVLDTRARALSGLDELQPFSNKLDSAMGNAASKFSVVSLMAPWNAAFKQFSGVITQSRMLQASMALAAGKKLPTAEVENLALNYVDAAMAKRIASQFRKHGETKNGIYVPNARLWDDIDARDTFRAGVVREVDQTIITVGLDKPLWMSKSGWRLMGQFRSFAASSVQKTLLAGLQRRDAATLQGVVLSIALGMGVYAIKQAQAGKEVSDDWRVWANEGIDRSGVTGWFFDVNNIVEKVSRGRVGVNALVGGPVMSRYASRSALEAVFGPTYGAMGDVVQLAGSAAAGEWKASDTSTLRKLIPFQNLFYIRQIFDDAEDGVNSFLGVEAKR